MIKKLILTGLLSILGILTLTSSACMFVEGVDGNGNVQKQTREISRFDAIKISGAFEVFLTQGQGESLVIEADENLLPIIRTEVRGGTLIIKSEENIRNAKEMNVFISFQTLEDLDLSGAVEVESQNALNLDNLKIDGSGACEIMLDLTVKSMICEFSGASELELKGSAGTCVIDVSGAAEVDAYEFEVAEMEIEIGGAGDARVFVTQELEARVMGAGSIRYKGDPKIIFHESGSGSIKKR